jgi:glycerophosphoryl diester phosphodiesterase
VLILGHRGVRGSLPENTIDSLMAVFDHGADGAELDVRLTRDGVAILHHDATLRRLTGLPHAIADLEWSVLRSLTAEGPAPVATLAEAIDRLGPDAHLDIEIKDRGAERIAADLIAGRVRSGRVAISSFDPDVLESLRGLGSPVPRWLNADRVSDATIRLAAGLGAMALIVPVDHLSPAGVRRAGEAGLRTGCWGIRDAATLAWARSIGCHVAIPDLPLVATAADRDLADRAR